jgi:DNA-binding Lrp family transcriptional regulator
MKVTLEDEEGIIKGPHYYLLKRKPLEKLEKEALRLLSEEGPLPLSAIWRRLNCHLWEASAALRRLKEKGLVGESEAKPEDYRSP